MKVDYKAWNNFKKITLLLLGLSRSLSVFSTCFLYGWSLRLLNIWPQRKFPFLSSYLGTLVGYALSLYNLPTQMLVSCCVLWTWCLSTEPTKSHQVDETPQSTFTANCIFFYFLLLVVLKYLGFGLKLFLTRSYIWIICINKEHWLLRLWTYIMLILFPL